MDLLLLAAPKTGGDRRAVQDQLKGVQLIRTDGSAVAWGERYSGGDQGAVQDELKGVHKIQACAVL